MRKIHLKGEPLAIDFMDSLIGKGVYVPENRLAYFNELDGEVEENVWFAGLVVGYIYRHLTMDFAEDVILDVPVKEFSIILADGLEILLAEYLDMYEITEVGLKKLNYAQGEQEKITPEWVQGVLFD